jgi:excisionase family DNA binding protein
MTSTNGPSARDSSSVRDSAGKARDTGSVDSQQARTQFLTVAEVAALMRVSKMTVYRLVHNGELPAVRVGRSFRVHAKAVHDMLETSYFDAG